MKKVMAGTFVGLLVLVFVGNAGAVCGGPGASDNFSV